jgi:hypothetical protein
MKTVKSPRKGVGQTIGGIRYLAWSEQWRPKQGRMLVHNRVRHSRNARQGIGGFRYWEQASSPKLEECSCGWRPEWGTHYRVKM